MAAPSSPRGEVLTNQDTPPPQYVPTHEVVIPSMTMRDIQGQIDPVLVHVAHLQDVHAY